MEPTEFSAADLEGCRLYLDDEGVPRCMDCHATWDACDQPQPMGLVLNGGPLLDDHKPWPKFLKTQR